LREETGDDGDNIPGTREGAEVHTGLFVPTHPV